MNTTSTFCLDHEEQYKTISKTKIKSIPEVTTSQHIFELANQLYVDALSPNKHITKKVKMDFDGGYIKHSCIEDLAKNQDYNYTCHVQPDFNIRYELLAHEEEKERTPLKNISIRDKEYLPYLSAYDENFLFHQESHMIQMTFLPEFSCNKSWNDALMPQISHQIAAA